MKRLLRWQVVRWFLLTLVGLLVVAQLVPVDRSNPPVEEEVPAPAHVRAFLRRACYDCHSNETVWPWYSQVAPVSWLIAYDVHEGREELNFSTWNRLNPQKRAKKLQESVKEVTEGEMPPWFYTSIQRDATLSAEERAALRAWALSAGATAPAEKDDK